MKLITGSSKKSQNIGGDLVTECAITVSFDYANHGTLILILIVY